MSHIRHLLTEIRSLTEARLPADLGQAADLGVELIAAVADQAKDATTWKATTWKALRTALSQQLGFKMTSAEWATLQRALLAAGYQKGKDAQGEKGVLPPKDKTEKDTKELKASVRKALASLEPEPDDPAASAASPAKAAKAAKAAAATPSATTADPAGSAALPKMVAIASDALDKAGDRGLDWDKIVREVGKRRGKSLTPDDETALSGELEKLGIDFEDKGGGRITAKSAPDPDKAEKGIELAAKSVNSFEQAMKDVLDQVKIMDRGQGNMDKDRRAKLTKLVSTLKDVVSGASGSLEKATKSAPAKRGLLGKIFGKG